MISRYRVKEVEGKFIPQVWFFGWGGIDRDSEYIWYQDKNQYTWCGYSTLEQARERIREYRGYGETECKYHKA